MHLFQNVLQLWINTMFSKTLLMLLRSYVFMPEEEPAVARNVVAFLCSPLKCRELSLGA